MTKNCKSKLQVNVITHRTRDWMTNDKRSNQLHMNPLTAPLNKVAVLCLAPSLHRCSKLAIISACRRKFMSPGPIGGQRSWLPALSDSSLYSRGAAILFRSHPGPGVIFSGDYSTHTHSPPPPHLSLKNVCVCMLTACSIKECNFYFVRLVYSKEVFITAGGFNLFMTWNNYDKE